MWYGRSHQGGNGPKDGLDQNVYCVSGGLLPLVRAHLPATGLCSRPLSVICGAVRTFRRACVLQFAPFPIATTIPGNRKIRATARRTIGGRAPVQSPSFPSRLCEPALNQAARVRSSVAHRPFVSSKGERSSQGKRFSGGALRIAVPRIVPSMGACCATRPERFSEETHVAECPLVRGACYGK